MEPQDQRVLARRLRVEGLSTDEIRERIGRATGREGPVSRGWVQALLQATVDDPVTVNCCVWCKRWWETGDGNQRFCGVQCEEDAVVGRTVIVPVDGELWRALGYAREEVTGQVVREWLKKLVAERGVK